ncbi:MAG: FtsX-like permease family protein, partial [Acidobacteriia bacterium]|nr:FtsX-like permease family protein [Terriglobia bacterium]
VRRRHLRKYFSNFSDALRACGMETPHTGVKVPTAKLFADWARIARTLKKLPTTKAYRKLGRHSMEAVMRMCGQWSAVPRRMNGSSVEPNYFDAMHATIVRGRGFGVSGVTGNALNLVINETMARTWWPGEDPVGKTLWLGARPSERRMAQVIGMARDIHSYGLTYDASPRPEYYVSRRQDPGMGGFQLIVRTAASPYQWAEPLLRIARNSGPGLQMDEPASLEDEIARSLWSAKWQAALLGSLGLLALALAAIGLYGVVAFSVSQRTREIGVRMALGAKPGDVQWMALGRGLRITAAGLAAGLVLSAGTVRMLRSYLYGLSPFDPVAFAGASLVWALIAMLASWSPARRATRVDPITALKYD